MPDEYIVSTDKEERIDLESEIVSADWISTVANGGQPAVFEVDTVFVAEGSDIEITGYSSEGPPPGTVKGKVFANRFKGEILIPRNIESYADIWFEAKLPKHGLKMESSVIPGRPPIKIRKLCWDKEEITREEIVKMMCKFESGVVDGEEVFFIVYEHHPQGADLKVTTFPVTIEGMKAEMAWEFDYYDDTVSIPTDEEMKTVGKSYENPQYYFVVSVNKLTVGENRESGLLLFKDRLEARVLMDKQPVKDKEVKIVFADGTEKRAKTDEDGIVRIEKYSPGRVKIEVIRDDEETESEDSDSSTTSEQSGTDNNDNPGGGEEPSAGGSESGSGSAVHSDNGFSDTLSGDAATGGSGGGGVNDTSEADPEQEAMDADRWGFDMGG